MPLFSIIIPTCNRNNLLALCLQKLRPGAQTLDAALYEVIVSDDSPNNEAEAFVKANYDWVMYTPGPKVGPAANRNNGAKLAAGEWLVFTDDDCLPDANWLQAYADAIQQYAACKAFEGAILPDDWELLKKDMAECPVNTTGGCFWSANIMVQKQLFWELGGFDEQFKIAAQEDQDLQERIQKKSTVIFIYSSYVIHPVRLVSLKSKISAIPASTMNWHKYYRKNHGIISTVFKSFTSQALALTASIRKLKFKSILYHSIYLIITIPILIIQECKN